MLYRYYNKLPLPSIHQHGLYGCAIRDAVWRYFYANVAILYTSIIFIGNLALLAIHFAYKFVRKEFFSTPRKKPNTPASPSYPTSHQGAPSASQNATQRGTVVANPNLQRRLAKKFQNIFRMVNKMSDTFLILKKTWVSKKLEEDKKVRRRKKSVYLLS